MELTEQDYFENRVENQINWYDQKSSYYKRWFYLLKVSEIVLALLIPFLSGYISKDSSGRLVVTVGILGFAVAVLSSLNTLFKLQENWIQYRGVSESLKHEKFLYLTKGGLYGENGDFSVFAEKFENFLSKENAQWLSYIKANKPEPEPHE